MAELSRLYDKQEIQIPDDPVQWIESTRWLRGEPFSLKGRQYLKDIMRDPTEQIFIVKGRQTECSEMLVNLMMYNAVKYPGSVSLYMSKDWKTTRLFSNTRFRDMAVKPSPEWDKLFDESDKQIMSEKRLKNGSMIFFRSSWNSFDESRSMPVDMAYLDESQSSDLERLDVLLESMSHSKIKRLWAIGTGAPESSAWHQKYTMTKQHKWHKGRQKWQVVNDVKTDNMHGYHAPQSITPFHTQKEIDQKISQSPSEAIARQEIEGEFTSGASVPITKSMMNACLIDQEQAPGARDQDLFLGIDWGGGRAKTVTWLMHVQKEHDVEIFCLDEARVIETKSIDAQTQTIMQYIDKINPASIVVDSGGGMAQVQRLEARYTTRITRAWFNTDLSKPFEHISHENRVNLDRTTAIDKLISIINQTHLMLPKKYDWVIDHFTCLRSKMITLSSGQIYPKYDKVKGSNNDALMACVYAHAAHKLNGQHYEYFGMIG